MRLFLHIVYLFILASEAVFIDRDPTHFQLLLDFLATGNVNLPGAKVDIEQIKQETEVFLLKYAIVL